MSVELKRGTNVIAGNTIVYLSKGSMSGLTDPKGCAIAVMAKASAAGRVKTRLSPPLSPDESASFNTAFLRDIAENIRRASGAQPIRGFFAYGPPGEGGFFDTLGVDGMGRFECWFANFGVCLRHALTTALTAGHTSAGVLNADSPTLPSAYLAEAARRLAAPGDRAVLGPSADGGYYFLGVKQAHARLFEGIDWSTERVAAQTLGRAAEIGLPVHILPTWYDVDDRAALQTLYGELFGGRPYDDAADASPATHTRALMRNRLETTDFAARVGLRVEPPTERARRFAGDSVSVVDP